MATSAVFNGSDYRPNRDNGRLHEQLQRIFSYMRDGEWRTLMEIGSLTGDPVASISAQLRHMRKERFGLHVVNKRHRGPAATGLYEYQLLVNLAGVDPQTGLCLTQSKRCGMLSSVDKLLKQFNALSEDQKIEAAHRIATA